MMKKKQVSVMAAVAIALGATANYKFPGFSEATAIAAHSNNTYQATSSFGGKVNAKTKPGSLGPVQPNDDTYQAESTGKCGAQQASGGQKGDRRTIKFPVAKGKKTIRIAYNMLVIPDRLEVISKGKVILNTGFVSGRKIRSLSFNQSPKEITVVLTGNPANYTTLWAYKVFCPQ